MMNAPLRIVGNPDRLMSTIQIMTVIEARIAEFYGIQTEDRMLQHMIENDAEMDTDFFANTCCGLADDDVWSLQPVQNMYRDVLKHYVLEHRSC